jgi:putative methionine-R-sulfoxide reductase with GAF domain
VQLPAYASLGGSSTAPALDLSEIININEDGMAIQTSSPLEVNQHATFSLDLPETHALIRTEGQVIWAGSSGRVGVRFSDMAPELKLALKQWLFANAIAAYANQTEDVSHALDLSDENLPPQQSPGAAIEDFGPRPDHTAVLSALAAATSEVKAVGDDLEAALFLIARRAQTFTRASSAAIALTEGQDMVCRANAGPSAPPLGAHLKIGSGFSGLCVRTGLLLRCDDSETDERVDRESCRFLAVRSMIAAPIRWDVSTIGLLEVFSTEAHAFGSEAELVVSRLAEITSNAVHRAGSPLDCSPPKLANVDDEFSTEELTNLPLPELSRSRNALLAAAGITIVLVILWLTGTWKGDGSHRAISSPSVKQSQAIPASSPATSAAADDFQALRRLADQGDPAAQFAVGASYATGEDAPQDYTEAVRWFTKAAEQGHVAAQATLGAYYWAGRGVPPDLSRAYFWSFLAEAGGDEASRSRVALLASRLTRDQIVVAQKQANEWLKRHPVTENGAPDVK